MRIGNEVGWMTQLIATGDVSMMKRAVTPHEDKMHTLNNQAVRASYKMQIIYLVNLFESFMQDYIAVRDNLDELQMSKKGFLSEYLNPMIKKWDDYCQKNDEAINPSTSFMNINFSLFILKEKYNLNFPSYLAPTIRELGSLRNCLVHHDGDLNHVDKGGFLFRETLVLTLNFLAVTEAESYLKDLNHNNFIDKVTFDLQTFIELCGGRITRVKEHEKET